MLQKTAKLDLVLFLLRNGAQERPLLISTTQLAEELSISQQTASRWLIELEEEKYVERSRTGIRLTSFMMDRLRATYGVLKTVFETPYELVVKGRVTTGVGDGAHYMSMPEYKKQFRERLKWEPFAGTLNLAIEDREKKGTLTNSPGLEISGFFKGGRTLGAAKCFPCRINGKIDGAVIIPLRSHYGSEILEIIAPVDLREKLKLKDDDEVTVQVKRV